MARALYPVDRDIPDEIEPPPMLTFVDKPPRPLPMSKAGGVVCPHCMSQSHVEKVSRVVSGGRGQLYWENGEVAHYETDLSRLLEAPPQPRNVPLLKAALGLLAPLVLLGLTLLILSVLEAQDYVGISQDSLDTARDVAIGWFGVVVPLALIAIYIKSRLDLRKKLPVWRVANRRWSGLYYCSHDDVVFEPYHGEVASPREMDRLLYVADVPDRQPHHARPVLRGLSALGVILVLLGGSLTGLTSADRASVNLDSVQFERQVSDVQGVFTQQALEPAAGLPHRSNCDEIKGTEYQSPDERTWYLANCLQQ